MLAPLVLALAFASSSLSRSLPSKRQADLEGFIQSERSISLEGVLANIGGTNVSTTFNEDADPGIVVASPSRVNPDYYFTWTRDSALTYSVIIDELLFGNSSLIATIEDYTRSQAVLQTVDNPSGSLYPAGRGLGEPKFNTNKTRFDSTWGRPQNDGPALRATALMKVANFLLSINMSDVVRNAHWPIVENDLRYVGQYWNESGYELWEEVHGTSFFTLMAQHRALVEGAMFAEALGEECPACNQSSQILCFLQNNYWNGTGGYITADVNPNVNRSGINVSPLLASIHVFDINATCNASDYQPCNSQILATHKVVVDSFREIYPINGNASAPEAVLVGRYPEDTYYEGNPWPLCTLGCAELLYDAAAQFEQAGQINVDQYSLAFFQDIYPQAEEAMYEDDAMMNITQAMRTYADGFVSLIELYLPQNGSLSEQFNKTTGESTSASKLTWSFASFISMAQRRAGQYPASWGAGSELANTNVTQCEATSYNATGMYAPARSIGAPAVDMDCSSEIHFAVLAPTEFGQNVYILGNTSLLGDSLSEVSSIILPLGTGNLTADAPYWDVDIWLPAGESFEYLYVLQDTREVATQEWIFENVTRTVMNTQCGSSQVVLTQDVASFPMPS